MYKIIGADQKEYGPVSADQLRQWVAEGRVNGQTMVRAEGQTEWKPLSQFPEFEQILQTLPAQAPTPSSSFRSSRSSALSMEEVLGRDYDLDIGACVTRSWELVKQNFWPIVGVSVLIWIISAAINQVIGLPTRPIIQGMILAHHFSIGGTAIVLVIFFLASPVHHLLMGGLFNYYLRLIRGESPALADAFAGFRLAAGQLILLGLVSGILTTIGFFLCVIPMIYLKVSWAFAIPLVIDRKLGFWDAMEFSRKAVGKHWFITFAFLLVIGLLALCGIFACCVGFAVTAPIALIALLYAYEDIFSRQGP